MSDLISREAAIAAIENARQLFALPDDVPGSRMVNAGFAAARGALEKAPPESGWIPVKDKLPESGSICLVCGAKGGIRVARFRSVRAEWTIVGAGKPFNATHWMELPAPPSE